MEFVAPSGATVTINAASWKDAKVLKKAIERELATRAVLNFDPASNDISNLLQTIFTIDSSEAVDAALWPCLVRCLRGKEKVTESTFDSLEARQDYYAIAIACGMENLRPLVESLFSQLHEHGLLKKRAEPNPASI